MKFGAFAIATLAAAVFSQGIEAHKLSGNVDCGLNYGNTTPHKKGRVKPRSSGEYFWEKVGKRRGKRK